MTKDIAKKNIDFSFLVDDDAERFLASTSPAELRPQFGHNGLPETTGSFTPEEKEIAAGIVCPPVIAR